jgi:hypothetical protein
MIITLVNIYGDREDIEIEENVASSDVIKIGNTYFLYCDVEYQKMLFRSIEEPVEIKLYKVLKMY